MGGDEICLEIDERRVVAEEVLQRASIFITVNRLERARYVRREAATTAATSL